MTTPKPATEKKSAGRNLPAAIGIAAVLLAVILSGLLVWPWLFIIFWMVALTFGAGEVLSALERLDMRGAKPAVLAGLPVTLAASYWVTSCVDMQVGFATQIAGLALTTLVALFTHLLRDVTRFVKDAAASLFTIAYLGLLGTTAGTLLAQPDGGLRLLFLFACVPCSDTGAYAVGSLIGKHKMAKTISPGKTWEGFVGGLVVASAVGAFFAVWLLQTDWWRGLIIGAALSVAGTLGDLIESIIKRNAGLKDMGKVLPGHGGAMDRLDSLLAALPVLWMLMYFLV